jgi:undecaprenyl-diphosphatase
MDLRDFLIALVMGIVEGATEFIPVSSTGHLIVVGELLGFTGEKAATFEVVIQLGAVLAVVFLYRDRLRALQTLRVEPGFAGRRGLLLLALATFPALVVGAAAHSAIKEHLFSPTTVAIGWGLGGIAILLVERYRPPVRIADLDAIGWRQALAIGLFQCLALWPGVSRAASTILGGMIVGMGRTAAAEFSFLAAIPIILAASVYDLFASRDILGLSDIPFFAVGFIVSFLTAWLAVRFFLRFLQTATLRPFGWYRIVAAIVALLVIASGRLGS